MDINTNQTFSSRICSRCGGPAPDWKCPECSVASSDFNPMHFNVCKGKGKMQAQCQECGEAESKCTCEASKPTGAL